MRAWAVQHPLLFAQAQFDFENYHTSAPPWLDVYPWKQNLRQKVLGVEPYVDHPLVVSGRSDPQEREKGQMQPADAVP